MTEKRVEDHEVRVAVFDGENFTEDVLWVPRTKADDLYADLRLAGFDRNEVFDEWAAFPINIFRSRSAWLIDIFIGDNGVAMVRCDDLKSFLIFFKEYVTPFADLSIKSKAYSLIHDVQDTLFDERDGLPEVRRVRERESKYERARLRERGL